jgi:hypothetical protein
MSRRACIALVLTTQLSGCGAAVMGAVVMANDGRMTGVNRATFPAVMLVSLPGGDEELLTGELEEMITGRASYTLTGPTWGTCTGSETNGRNAMTCSGGPSVSFTTPVEGPKVSAVHVADVTVDGAPARVAIAWGDRANARTVRGALAGG